MSTSLEENRPQITSPHDLVPAMRAMPHAKLERLLARPLIARVAGTTPAGGSRPNDDDVPDAFRALRSASFELEPNSGEGFRESSEDGTCVLRISIDYDDRWRGCEKEIHETVKGAVESAVTFLTDAQKLLLERSPREFLALSPAPETAELISFETEKVGGSTRVVELRLAAAPESRRHIHHVAIVPNLVQIERQLDALLRLESATDDGPLGPLRALVGACGAASLASSPVEVEEWPSTAGLDEHQQECVRKAVATPHFAVIEGPPGSGKTTVISEIIRRTLARGERVLVVSPTHVAVDNVVERLVKLKPNAEDRLEPHSLPLRYAARSLKLSPTAKQYWVGAKRQLRGAAIARRVQASLCASVPFADALFRNESEESGQAPISSAVAAVDSVVCGTPIGILSYAPVKNALPGSFGLLVVDEVSKMTLPEFLAIAVKAKRWVVVGDPAQLPPYNNSEENGTALDDVVSPVLELACSVGSILERAKPALRSQDKLVVVSTQPARAAAAIQAHVASVGLVGAPSVDLFENADRAGILVCSPDQTASACEMLSLRSPNGTAVRRARILVERGVVVQSPGERAVEPRERAHAAIFETAFQVYHSQPWGRRSEQRLRFLGFRNGLEKCLPSAAALEALTGGSDRRAQRASLVEEIARRFAIATVSVYDWLSGIPSADLDVSPLRELATLASRPLCDVVRPFVGTLKKQYRMHSSLSRVPRELFYFGEALDDGRSDEQSGCRAVLVQVANDCEEAESNSAEIKAIINQIAKLSSSPSSRERRPQIMVITPYKEQEARLERAIDDLRSRGAMDHVDVEVCTLDRCQGREAEYVLISLVRNRATPFFDMPKRWNVALTRAKEGLFIVGDVHAYLREAQIARRELCGQAGYSRAPAGETRPLMSLLARIIEAYDQQATLMSREGSKLVADNLRGGCR